MESRVRPAAASTFSWRAAIALSLLLVAAAGAVGHGPSVTGEDEDGNDGYPAGPLGALQFVGRKGTPIEKAPCATAPPGGPLDEKGHIAHIRTIIGKGQPPGDGSVANFHLEEYKNVEAFERANGEGSVMLGTHGFLAYKLPVDGTDTAGIDFTAQDVHGPSSFCMWGAVAPGGPFYFIGNGFQSRTPQGTWTHTDYFDLGADYVPLFEAATGDPAHVRYILIQASRDVYPWLKADFAIRHQWWMGDPVPVSLQDRSARGSAEALPIHKWEWWQDTNPGAGSSINMALPPDMECWSRCVLPPQSIPANTETTFCLRVSVVDAAGTPVQQDSRCRVLVLAPAPPVGSPPTVTLAGLGTGPRELAWTVDAFAHDPECLEEGVWWSLDGAAAVEGGATWSGQLPDLNPHFLVATVFDCSDQSSPPFTLRMQGIQTPPRLDPLPELTRTVGDYTTFQVRAEDDDGDPLTFTFDGLPPGSRFEPLGSNQYEFRWLTDNASPGKSTIVVTVTDGTVTLQAEAVIHLLQPPRDSDGDGVADGADTCAGTPNHAQGGCQAPREETPTAPGRAARQEPGSWEGAEPNRCVPPYEGAPDPCAGPVTQVRPEEQRVSVNPCSERARGQDAKEQCRAAVDKLRDSQGAVATKGSGWLLVAGVGFGFAAALLLVLAVGPALLVAIRRRR